jgi:hypothetical protein
VLWSDFRQAVVSLRASDKGTLARTLAPSIDIVYMLTTRSPLEILSMTRNKTYTEPRDRLYGLLSLMPESFRETVSVDYTRRLEDVYRDGVLVLEKHSFRLDGLRYVSASKGIPRLPSWVPGWSEIPLMNIDVHSAAANYTRSYLEFIPPDRIKVAGTKVDTISHVGSQRPWDRIEFAALVRQEWAQISHMSSYVTGEAILDAFVRTITFNMNEDRHPGTGYETFAQHKEEFESFLEFPGVEHKRNIEPGFVDWLYMLQGSWFFSTRNGYIGISFEKPQAGQSSTYFCDLTKILQKTFCVFCLAALTQFSSAQFPMNWPRLLGLALCLDLFVEKGFSELCPTIIWHALSSMSGRLVGK